jgi:hypothetical protein
LLGNGKLAPVAVAMNRLAGIKALP